MKLPIKKERIFRTIIGEEEFTFGKVRKSTDLSKSFVSKTLSELAEKNLIVKYEKKYEIINSEILLREWALIKRRIFNSLKPVKLFFFMRSKIREVFSNYAISGAFAEYLINGQTKGEEVIVYVPEIKKDISKYLSIKPNTLVFVYDEHMFSSSWKFRNWNLVSVPQLCADLLAQGIYADIALDLFRRWLNDRKRIG